MHYNPDLSGDVELCCEGCSPTNFPAELIEQIIEKHFLPDGLGVGVFDVIMSRLERIESREDKLLAYFVAKTSEVCRHSETVATTAGGMWRVRCIHCRADCTPPRSE
jgi:hypothetical protein